MEERTPKAATMDKKTTNQPRNPSITVDENIIKSVVTNMKYFMEIYSIDEAVSTFSKSPYKHLDFNKDKTNDF